VFEQSLGGLEDMKKVLASILGPIFGPIVEEHFKNAPIKGADGVSIDSGTFTKEVTSKILKDIPIKKASSGPATHPALQSKIGLSLDTFGLTTILTRALSKVTLGNEQAGASSSNLDALRPVAASLIHALNSPNVVGLLSAVHKVEEIRKLGTQVTAPGMTKKERESSLSNAIEIKQESRKQIKQVFDGVTKGNKKLKVAFENERAYADDLYEQITNSLVATSEKTDTIVGSKQPRKIKKTSSSSKVKLPKTQSPASVQRDVTQIKTEAEQEKIISSPPPKKPTKKVVLASTIKDTVKELQRNIYKDTPPYEYVKTVIQGGANPIRIDREAPRLAAGVVNEVGAYVENLKSSLDTLKDNVVERLDTEFDKVREKGKGNWQIARKPGTAGRDVFQLEAGTGKWRADAINMSRMRKVIPSVGNIKDLSTVIEQARNVLIDKDSRNQDDMAKAEAIGQWLRSASEADIDTAAIATPIKKNLLEVRDKYNKSKIYPAEALQAIRGATGNSPKELDTVYRRTWGKKMADARLTDSGIIKPIIIPAAETDTSGNAYFPTSTGSKRHLNRFVKYVPGISKIVDTAIQANIPGAVSLKEKARFAESITPEGTALHDINKQLEVVLPKMDPSRVKEMYRDAVVSRAAEFKRTDPNFNIKAFIEKNNKVIETLTKVGESQKPKNLLPLVRNMMARGITPYHVAESQDTVEFSNIFDVQNALLEKGGFYEKAAKNPYSSGSEAMFSEQFATSMGLLPVSSDSKAGRGHFAEDRMVIGVDLGASFPTNEKGRFSVFGDPTKQQALRIAIDKRLRDMTHEREVLDREGGIAYKKRLPNYIKHAAATGLTEEKSSWMVETKTGVVSGGDDDDQELKGASVLDVLGDSIMAGFAGGGPQSRFGAAITQGGRVTTSVNNGLRSASTSGITTSFPLLVTPQERALQLANRKGSSGTGYNPLVRLEKTPWGFEDSIIIGGRLKDSLLEVAKTVLKPTSKGDAYSLKSEKELAMLSGVGGVTPGVLKGAFTDESMEDLYGRFQTIFGMDEMYRTDADNAFIKNVKQATVHSRGKDPVVDMVEVVEQFGSHWGDKFISRGGNKGVAISTQNYKETPITEFLSKAIKAVGSKKVRLASSNAASQGGLGFKVSELTSGEQVADIIESLSEKELAKRTGKEGFTKKDWQKVFTDSGNAFMLSAAKDIGDTGLLSEEDALYFREVYDDYLKITKQKHEPDEFKAISKLKNLHSKITAKTGKITPTGHADVDTVNIASAPTAGGLEVAGPSYKAEAVDMVQNIEGAARRGLQDEVWEAIVGNMLGLGVTSGRQIAVKPTVDKTSDYWMGYETKKGKNVAGYIAKISELYGMKSGVSDKPLEDRINDPELINSLKAKYLAGKDSPTKEEDANAEKLAKEVLRANYESPIITETGKLATSLVAIKHMVPINPAGQYPSWTAGQIRSGEKGLKLNKPTYESFVEYFGKNSAFMNEINQSKKVDNEAMQKLTAYLVHSNNVAPELKKPLFENLPYIPLGDAKAFAQTQGTFNIPDNPAGDLTNTWLDTSRFPDAFKTNMIVGGSLASPDISEYYVPGGDVRKTYPNEQLAGYHVPNKQGRLYQKLHDAAQEVEDLTAKYNHVVKRVSEDPNDQQAQWDLVAFKGGEGKLDKGMHTRGATVALSEKVNEAIATKDISTQQLMAKRMLGFFKATGFAVDKTLVEGLKKADVSSLRKGVDAIVGPSMERLALDDMQAYLGSKPNMTQEEYSKDDVIQEFLQGDAGVNLLKTTQTHKKITDRNSMSNAISARSTFLSSNTYKGTKDQRSSDKPYDYLSTNIKPLDEQKDKQMLQSKLGFLIGSFGLAGGMGVNPESQFKTGVAKVRKYMGSIIGETVENLSGKNKGIDTLISKHIIPAQRGTVVSVPMDISSELGAFQKHIESIGTTLEDIGVTPSTNLKELAKNVSNINKGHIEYNKELTDLGMPVLPMGSQAAHPAKLRTMPVTFRKKYMVSSKTGRVVEDPQAQEIDSNLLDMITYKARLQKKLGKNINKDIRAEVAAFMGDELGTTVGTYRDPNTGTSSVGTAEIKSLVVKNKQGKPINKEVVVIPTVPRLDMPALEETRKTFSSFIDDLVQQREKAMKAGDTKKGDALTKAINSSTDALAVALPKYKEFGQKTDFDGDTMAIFAARVKEARQEMGALYKQQQGHSASTNIESAYRSYKDYEVVRDSAMSLGDTWSDASVAFYKKFPKETGTSFGKTPFSSEDMGHLTPEASLRLAANGGGLVSKLEEYAASGEITGRNVKKLGSFIKSLKGSGKEDDSSFIMDALQKNFTGTAEKPGLFDEVLRTSKREVAARIDQENVTKNQFKMHTGQETEKMLRIKRLYGFKPSNTEGILGASGHTDITRMFQINELLRIALQAGMDTKKGGAPMGTAITEGITKGVEGIPDFMEKIANSKDQKAFGEVLDLASATDTAVRKRVGAFHKETLWNEVKSRAKKSDIIPTQDDYEGQVDFLVKKEGFTGFLEEAASHFENLATAVYTDYAKKNKIENPEKYAKKRIAKEKKKGGIALSSIQDILMPERGLTSWGADPTGLIERYERSVPAEYRAPIPAWITNDLDEHARPKAIENFKAGEAANHFLPKLFDDMFNLKDQPTIYRSQINAAMQQVVNRKKEISEIAQRASARKIELKNPEVTTTDIIDGRTFSGEDLLKNAFSSKTRGDYSFVLGENIPDVGVYSPSTRRNRETTKKLKDIASSLSDKVGVLPRKKEESAAMVQSVKGLLTQRGMDAGFTFSESDTPERQAEVSKLLDNYVKEMTTRVLAMDTIARGFGAAKSRNAEGIVVNEMLNPSDRLPMSKVTSEGLSDLLLYADTDEGHASKLQEAMHYGAGTTLLPSDMGFGAQASFGGDVIPPSGNGPLFGGAGPIPVYIVGAANGVGFNVTPGENQTAGNHALDNIRGKLSTFVGGAPAEGNPYVKTKEDLKNLTRKISGFGKYEAPASDLSKVFKASSATVGLYPDKAMSIAELKKTRDLALHNAITDKGGQRDSLMEATSLLGTIMHERIGRSYEAKYGATHEVSREVPMVTSHKKIGDITGIADIVLKDKKTNEVSDIIDTKTSGKTNDTIKQLLSKAKSNKIEDILAVVDSNNIEHTRAAHKLLETQAQLNIYGASHPKAALSGHFYSNKLSPEKLATTKPDVVDFGVYNSAMMDDFATAVDEARQTLVPSDTVAKAMSKEQFIKSRESKHIAEVSESDLSEGHAKALQLTNMRLSSKIADYEVPYGGIPAGNSAKVSDEYLPVKSSEDFSKAKNLRKLFKYSRGLISSYKDSEGREISTTPDKDTPTELAEIIEQARQGGPTSLRTDFVAKFDELNKAGRIKGGSFSDIYRQFGVAYQEGFANKTESLEKEMQKLDPKSDAWSNAYRLHSDITSQWGKYVENTGAKPTSIISPHLFSQEAQQVQQGYLSAAGLEVKPMESKDILDEIFKGNTDKFSLLTEIIGNKNKFTNTYDTILDRHPGASARYIQKSLGAHDPDQENFGMVTRDLQQMHFALQIVIKDLKRSGNIEEATRVQTIASMLGDVPKSYNKGMTQEERIKSGFIPGRIRPSGMSLDEQMFYNKAKIDSIPEYMKREDIKRGQRVSFSTHVTDDQGNVYEKKRHTFTKKDETGHYTSHEEDLLQPRNTLMGAFGRALRWGVAARVIYGGAAAVTQGVQDTAQTEYQMAELKKIMDSPKTDFGAMQKGAFDIGKQYGVNPLEVMKSMNVYAQMGLKQQDVLAMSRVSTLASNVTTLKPQEATEAFTAATKTYGKAGENPMKYLDAWTEVEAKHAVTSQDLANGVKKVGTVARTVGVDFDQLNGLIAGIGSTTRQTGNEIGTSLKFVFSRLTTEKGPAALSKLGISVKDSVGDYRSGFDILGDVAGRWKDLTSAQKLHTAQAIGGTRQYNTVMVAMDNWGEVLDATKASLNSTGSAERRNLEIMDTYVKKMEQVKAAAMEVKVALGSAFLDIAKPALTGVKAVLGAFTNMPDVVAYPAAALGMGALGMAKGYGGMEMASITGVKWIGDAFSRGKENFGKGVYQTLGIDRKNKATDITGEIIEGVTDVAYIEELKKKQKVGKFEAAEVKRVRDMTSLKDTEGSLFGGVGYGVTWAGRGILRAGGKAAEKVGWKYGAEGLAKAGMTAEMAATKNAATVAAGGVGTAVGGSGLAAFAAVAAVLVAIYATSKAIGAAWNYVNESADGYRDSMTKSLAETDEQLTNVRNLNSDFKRTSDIKSRSNFNALDQMDVNVRETEFANSMAAFNPEVAIGVDSLGNAILGVSDSLGVAKGSMEAFMSAAERSLIGEKLGKQFEIIKRYSEEIADVGAGETFKSGLKKALGWTGIVDPNITSAYKLKNATEAINSLTYQRTKAPIGERGTFNEKLREQWGIATKSKIDQATLASTFNKYISGLDFGKNSAFKLEDVFGYINQPDFDAGFSALASDPRYKGTGTNADSIRAMKAMTVKYNELTPFLETTQLATDDRFRQAGIAPLDNFDDITRGSLVMFNQKMSGVVNGMGVVEEFDKKTREAKVSYVQKNEDGTEEVKSLFLDKDMASKEGIVSKIYESRAIVRGIENQRKELQESVTGAAAGLKPLLTEKQFKEEIDMGVKYYSQIPKSTLMQTGYAYSPFRPEEYTRYPGETEKGAYFGVPEENKVWVDQFQGFREKYKEYTSTMERLGLVEGKGESDAVDAMPPMALKEAEAFNVLKNEIKDMQVIFQFRDSIVELYQAMEEADRTAEGLIATEKRRGEVDLEAKGYMKGVPTSLIKGVDVGITAVSSMTDQQKLFRASESSQEVGLKMSTLELKRNKALSRMDLVSKTESSVDWLYKMYKNGGNIPYNMDNVLKSTVATGGDIGAGIINDTLGQLKSNSDTTNSILAAIEVNTAEKNGEPSVGTFRQKGDLALDIPSVTLFNTTNKMAAKKEAFTAMKDIISIKTESEEQGKFYRADQAAESLDFLSKKMISKFGIVDTLKEIAVRGGGNKKELLDSAYRATGYDSDEKIGTIVGVNKAIKRTPLGNKLDDATYIKLREAITFSKRGLVRAEEVRNNAAITMADTTTFDNARTFFERISGIDGSKLDTREIGVMLSGTSLDALDKKAERYRTNKENYDINTPLDAEAIYALNYKAAGIGKVNTNGEFIPAEDFKEGDTIKTAFQRGWKEEDIPTSVFRLAAAKNLYEEGKAVRGVAGAKYTRYPAYGSSMEPGVNEGPTNITGPVLTENIEENFANLGKYFSDQQSKNKAEVENTGGELGKLAGYLGKASQEFSNLITVTGEVAGAISTLGKFSVENVVGEGQAGYKGDVRAYKFEKDLNPTQRMYAYGVGRGSLGAQKEGEIGLEATAKQAQKLLNENAIDTNFLASLDDGSAEAITKKQLMGTNYEELIKEGETTSVSKLKTVILDTVSAREKEIAAHQASFTKLSATVQALAIMNTLLAITVASFGRLKDSLQAVAGQRYVEDLPQYENFRDTRSKMYGGDSPSAAQAMSVDTARQSALLFGAVPDNFSLDKYETEALDLKYQLAMGGLDTRGRMDVTRKLRELPVKKQLDTEAYEEGRALAKMDRYVQTPYKAALDDLGALSTNMYLNPESKNKINNLSGLISDTMTDAYKKVPDGAGGYQFAGVSEDTSKKITEAYKEVMYSISGTDGKTAQDIINDNTFKSMSEPLNSMSRDTAAMVVLLDSILAASLGEPGSEESNKILGDRKAQEAKMDTMAADEKKKITESTTLTPEQKKIALENVDIWRKRGPSAAFIGGLSSGYSTLGGINDAATAMSLPDTAPVSIGKAAARRSPVYTPITFSDWEEEAQHQKDIINDMTDAAYYGTGLKATGLGSTSPMLDYATAQGFGGETEQQSDWKQKASYAALKMYMNETGGSVDPNPFDAEKWADQKIVGAKPGEGASQKEMEAWQQQVTDSALYNYAEPFRDSPFGRLSAIMSGTDEEGKKNLVGNPGTMGAAISGYGSSYDISMEKKRYEEGQVIASNMTEGALTSKAYADEPAYNDAFKFVRGKLPGEETPLPVGSSHFTTLTGYPITGNEAASMVPNAQAFPTTKITPYTPEEIVSQTVDPSFSAVSKFSFGSTTEPTDKFSITNPISYGETEVQKVIEGSTNKVNDALKAQTEKKEVEIVITNEDAVKEVLGKGYTSSVILEPNTEKFDSISFDKKGTITYDVDMGPIDTISVDKKGTITYDVDMGPIDTISVDKKGTITYDVDMGSIDKISVDKKGIITYDMVDTSIIDSITVDKAGKITYHPDTEGIDTLTFDKDGTVTYHANMGPVQEAIDGIKKELTLNVTQTGGSVGAMEESLKTISETFNDFLFRISDTESMVKGAVEMVNGIAEQNKVTSEEVGFVKENVLSFEARLYAAEVAKNDKTLLEELNGKINNLDNKYGPRIEEQSRTINKNKDLAGSKK
jgi:TP901 family phage tail tape measure protein